MSISYIDLKRDRNKPKLSLCLPDLNHTKIGNLNDVYNAELTVNQGILNELSFSIPLYIDRNGELIKNPLIDKFNGLYHVRSEWNGEIEYFVYTKGNRSLSDSGKEYTYRLLSIGHLLSKKPLKLYEEVSKSLSWFVADFLKETDWFLGKVDSQFDLIYRTYESTETTVLQAIFDIAEKFGALIKWDTVNQKIDFVNPEKDGLNKGFKIREGIFLESLNAEINYDEVVTRLYVYGEDGLEFRRLSPTGSNYIESFDWFMHPFECDANYNVKKSSKYMSDDLCIAIRKYEKKLADSTPSFKTYTTNKTAKEDEIQQREQELSVLETELKVILNERDVINGTYGEKAVDRADWNNVISRKNNKEAQIKSKQNVISLLENDLENINTQIDSLRKSLAVDNNFSSIQLRELNKFIIAKTYSNTSISDEQDLLDDGLEAFKKYNVPPTSLNISLVNFLNDFEFENIRNRIALGDTVTAKIQDMDLELSMKITQIKYNFDSDSYSLTVSNLKDLRDDWQQFLSKIYSAANTSTTVDMSKHLWDNVTNVGGLVNDMLNSAFDTGKNILLGGFENTVSITDRGLYSRHLYDPDTFLVINMAQLLITKNGGNSIEVAISADGIHAEKLVGRIILSTKLFVEDEIGVVSIQSGLQTIYDNYGVPRVFLGRYPTHDNPNVFDYGLRIDNGSFSIRTSSSDKRGVQINGQGIRGYNNNGVKTFDLDTSGHVSIIGSMTIKSSTSSNKGVVIDGDGIRGYNGSGTLMFEINNNGNAWFGGRLESATGTVNNLGGTINNMGGSFVGSINSDGVFKGVTTGSLSAQTVNAINIKAEQITSGKISSNLIDANSLTAATIDVDQLTANGIKVNSLSSISSDLGNITGGNITIDTDMTIGNNLYIGTHWQNQEKSIIFGGSAMGGARIDYTRDQIVLSAMAGVVCDPILKVNGILDLTGATVIGL